MRNMTTSRRWNIGEGVGANTLTWERLLLYLSNLTVAQYGYNQILFIDKISGINTGANPTALDTDSMVSFLKGPKMVKQDRDSTR